MRICICNQQMWPFRGTENWCYAVGSELARRGFEVYMYSPMPREGIPYFARAGIGYAVSGRFDLILDNHSVLSPSITAPTVIHTCHGTIREERPYPGVMNVAVNERVAAHWGIGTIIPNGIDTVRMRPVSEPHPEIRSMLSLCSARSADSLLDDISRETGIPLVTTSGKEVFDVQRLINEADIVFGVGRSVLDAMSCGRPVISFDDRPYLPIRMHGCGYVTPEMVEANRDNMTGRDSGMSVSRILEEMKKYDPADGARNRDYIVARRNVKDSVDAYLRLAGLIM